MLHIAIFNLLFIHIILQLILFIFLIPDLSPVSMSKLENYFLFRFFIDILVDI